MPRLQFQSKPATKKSSLKVKKRKIRRPISGITFDQNETFSNRKSVPAAVKQPSELSKPFVPVKEQCTPETVSQSKGPRYSFSTEIPEKYQDFYLCALPRDPQWLYVYWEFPDETKGHHKLISANSDNAQWILRLKADEHSGKKEQFDVPIDIVVSNWYVKIPEPGVKYNIECGQLSKEGHFTPHSMTTQISVPSPAVQQPSANDPAYASTEMLIEYSTNTSVMKGIANDHDRSRRIPNARASHFTSDANECDGNGKRYFGSGCE